MTHTTTAEPAIAAANKTFSSGFGKQVKTPQRKARTSNRSRVRLKDVKGWALKRCGCSSSAEVKNYLKQLGIKLDLRMTSAWVAINKELVDKIVELKHKQPLSQEAAFKVGDRVIWDYPMGWGYIESWFPLIVTKVENGMAHLDLLDRPVPVSELSLVA